MFTQRIQAVPTPQHAAESTPAVAADLETRIQLRFQHAPYYELRHVTCSVQDGVPILRGHVSSYYMCQKAQSLLQEVDGVTAIDNRLEVVTRRDPRERCYAY